MTTPVGQPGASRGKPSGSGPTATSLLSIRTALAASRDKPTTFGTVTRCCLRPRPAPWLANSLAAASTARAARESVAGETTPVGTTSSKSRHRSHADCLAIPTRAAISAHEEPRRRAARTAASSASSSRYRNCLTSLSAPNASELLGGASRTSPNQERRRSHTRRPSLHGSRCAPIPSG